MKVATSFLSCKKVLKVVEKLNVTDADYIHVDFIDNSFVEGKKIPFRKIKKIPCVTSKRLDIHLMTRKLKKYIKKFCMLNCSYITFHIEAVKEKDVEKYIKLIRTYGIKCGIAINPNTSIDVIKPYLEMLDLVLVMGVNPGYGGQEFIEDVITKMAELKKYKDENKLDLIISCDGGINDKTISKVKDYVDMVVAGSYVTNGDYQERINSLRK